LKIIIKLLIKKIKLFAIKMTKKILIQKNSRMKKNKLKLLKICQFLIKKKIANNNRQIIL
jgi:hypothetical protein